jgi:hypothetical protein
VSETPDQAVRRHSDHDPGTPCRPAGNGLCEPVPEGARLVPWREVAIRKDERESIAAEVNRRADGWAALDDGTSDTHDLRVVATTLRNIAGSILGAPVENLIAPLERS